MHKQVITISLILIMILAVSGIVLPAIVSTDQLPLFGIIFIVVSMISVVWFLIYFFINK